MCRGLRFGLLLSYGSSSSFHCREEWKHNIILVQYSVRELIEVWDKWVYSLHTFHLSLSTDAWRVSTHEPSWEVESVKKSEDFIKHETHECSSPEKQVLSRLCINLLVSLYSTYCNSYILGWILQHIMIDFESSNWTGKTSEKSVHLGFSS